MEPSTLGAMLGYIVVGAAILILALAFDVLDPAKRAARRQRRDAYRAAQHKAPRR